MEVVQVEGGKKVRGMEDGGSSVCKEGGNIQKCVVMIMKRLYIEYSYELFACMDIKSALCIYVREKCVVKH